MISLRVIRSNGFTAVELLVAIIIGVTMISAAYQLYSVGLSSSGDAQRRTKASNVAYDLLRQQQAAATTGPCVAGTVTPAVPADSNLTNATASVATTCPYNEMQADGVTIKRVSPVRLLTTTITYDGGKTVVRAIAITP
jgi:prepilin-type N-terminal cleavage/methylation domain-containing protein